MENELFKDFKELIQDPLEQSDPRSYNLVLNFFTENQPQQNPFGVLIHMLTGKSYHVQRSVSHWRNILENKRGLEQKLGRSVGIRTAAVDYVEQQTSAEFVAKQNSKPVPAPSSKAEEKEIEKLCFPGSHLEKLKEEMLRAKRYQHALSAIILDVDEFERINETFTSAVTNRILIIIIKIIKKTVRTVDILACYSRDRFMLILPNTNKREAMELAERLRQNINQRTKRIEGLTDGVTVTLSVSQCSRDESSVDFLKRLESILAQGKRKGKNAVYSV